MNTAAEHASSGGSFWKKLPDMWKFVTVVIAIGGTAIAGYRLLDDKYDELIEADRKLQTRLEAIESSMIRSGDLDDLVANATLRTETCILVLRARMHEYRATTKAYEEILQAMDLANLAFVNRDLSAAQERQLDSLLELKSGYQTKRAKVEEDSLVLEGRINLREGC